MKNKFFLSAAILVLSSGFAVAQCSDGCIQYQTQVSDDGSLAIVLQTNFVQADQPESHSKMVMVQNNGDHEYKVVIEDDKVQAWADGEKVSRKHLKVNDDLIRILDADGKTVAEFARGRHMMQGFQGAPQPHSAPRRLHDNRDNDGPIVWHEDDKERNAPRVQVQPGIFGHPSVMIGIQMGAISEDTADDLEIDPEEAIRVMKVISDLPADKAGLKKGDIIVRVDGKSVEYLGDILKGKESGQKIKLRIVRGDDEKTITIKLAAWDDKALGINNDQETFFGRGADLNDPAIKKLIEKIEKLQFNDGKDQQDREATQKKIEKLLQEYSKSQGNPMDFRGDLEGYPRMRLFDEGNGQPEHSPRVLVEPDLSNRDMRQYRQRIDHLENRLERIEDRLDRILELLEQSREQDDD